VRIAQARRFSSPARIRQRLRLRRDPGSVYPRHAARARRLGVGTLQLILSFDCDTTEDIDSVWGVHERLLAMDVQPSYAVPGALLRAGADVYRRIAATGSEFLNHGDREHTYFDEERGRFASCFFYDQIGPDRVRADIEGGDRSVREVLGVAPQGFRAPHFGTYQRPGQLRFLHTVLRRLGASFSTSTGPFYGLRYGPVFRRFGLPELPVSGMATSPLTILDTWSCFEAPDRTRTPDDFRNEAEALVHGHAAAGAGIINVYGDPSHIHDRQEFFDGIAAMRAAAQPSSFAGIVEGLR
jgi:hypothetical protein